MNSQRDWQQANQRLLKQALQEVRQCLMGSGETKSSDQTYHVTGNPEQQSGPVTTLDLLCHRLNLSRFERALLLLCVGVELESDFARYCGEAVDNPKQTFPTFQLALAKLPAPHWDALIPTAPLRYWQLIRVDDEAVLMTSPLRVDERILHYLMGVSYLDNRLQGCVRPLQVDPLLSSPQPSSYGSVAEEICHTLEQSTAEALPQIHLCTTAAASARSLISAVGQRLQLNIYELDAQDLPATAAARETWRILWEREAMLSGGALLVEVNNLSAEAHRGVLKLLDDLKGIVFSYSSEPLRLHQKAVLTWDVATPTAQEQQRLWQAALGETAAQLNGQLINVVSQFSLGPAQIQSASRWVLNNRSADPENQTAEVLTPMLWQACRMQSRSRLDDLAQRIETVATWDDLVLPPGQTQTLQEIADHVRQRGKVYEAWGFGNKGKRGLGISALFAGPSGTGKTLAAEVLAQALALDLYRIDLSSVVSKYIGETEKNLRQIFDAADAGGVILLFDEADALFGKRSEVKDAHDRHANIEVSYLLQRMEAYRGLAILTTNLKKSLDQAFLRRIRFVVPFPFPDVEQRREIWQKVFPPQTPTEGLEQHKLARLKIAGGNIRNIAMNAAFLAATQQQPVQMYHLLRAAQGEYAKLEKSLAETEVRGWI